MGSLVYRPAVCNAASNFTEGRGQIDVLSLSPWLQPGPFRAVFMVQLEEVSAVELGGQERGHCGDETLA